MQDVLIQLKKTILTSVAWTAGYGSCWLAKWIISSIVLRRNVIMDALNTMVFRVKGSEEYVLDKGEMLKSNIRQLYGAFATENRGMVLLIVAIIGCLLIIALKNKTAMKYSPLLFIALYPYIWYCVLGNHSQIHYYFTYRAQLVTVFGILVFILENIKVSKKGSQLNGDVP